MSLIPTQNGIPRYPDKDNYFYVYYRLEGDQWIIVAVHPTTEGRPDIEGLSVVVTATDELGAYQKVSKWLEKSNGELANKARSSSTTAGSGGGILMAAWSAST